MPSESTIKAVQKVKIMTLSEARKIIAPLGFKLTFNPDYNEYRLVPGNGGEKQAYYTDSIEDAVGTAKFEANRSAALAIAKKKSA